MKFTGTVIHGDEYGRTLGYPTANISSEDYLTKKLNLEAGIYAGRVTIVGEDIPRSAAIVISNHGTEVKLEAHVLNFDKDIYDHEVTVEVLGFVRPYTDYANEDELVTAISEDVVKIKMMLGTYDE